MAVAQEGLSAEARAEAAALGLIDAFQAADPDADFEAFFARLEENYRAVAVAETRAYYWRYQGQDAGDVTRFHELNRVYCFSPAAEASVRRALETLPPGLLRRRAQLFWVQAVVGRVNTDPAVIALQGPLEERFVRFRAEGPEGPLSFAQLNQRVKSDPDRAKRRHAWEAFAGLGAEAGPRLMALVAARNHAAREAGYRDYIDLRWRLSDVDEPWLLSQLDALDARTEAPYRAALADVAESLGVEALEPWDVLYGIERYAPMNPTDFGADRALDEVYRLMRGWGFSNEEIDGISVRPCENFPWGGIACGIENGKEVAILMSPIDGPRFWRTLFHEFGHGIHFRLAGQSSLLLNVEEMAFNEGMSMFFESFVADPAWAVPALGFGGAKLSGYLKQARYVCLSWMRQLSAHIRFEHALYTSAPGALPAELFAAITERALGFPVSAEAASRWASDQMLIVNPAYWHTYLTGWMIAYQTRETLTAGGAPLVGNPAVGAFLRERYFEPAAALPWPEKVERATGKPLSGDAFFRYLASA